MLPARRSTPKHDPHMTPEHSTIARWTRLEVDFWVGKKPECPEKTLEVRLRSTATQCTYNIWSRGGRRDLCPLPRSTSQGSYLDGHPSRYQPRPIGINFDECTGSEAVFPFGDSRKRISCSKKFEQNHSNVINDFFFALSLSCFASLCLHLCPDVLVVRCTLNYDSGHEVSRLK